MVEKLCEVVSETTPLQAGVLREFLSSSLRFDIQLSLTFDLPCSQELARWLEIARRESGTRPKPSR